MASHDHPPAFLFYVKDFSSDGLVEAMSTEAVGAYILLLCKAWYENPPASIPNDDSVLARWTRLEPSRWAECRLSVLAPFTLGTDGRYHQKRLRRELDKLRTRQKLRHQAAVAGAEARWQPHANRMREAMPKDAISVPSSIPKNIPAAGGGSSEKGETGGHRALCDFWMESWNRRYGKKYAFQAKDGVAVSKLLKTLGTPASVQSAMTAYLADKDGFFKGHPLGKLLNDPNRFIVATSNTSATVGYTEQRRIEEAANLYAHELIEKQREQVKANPQ
jgi:uncharacterized protein YdaU (DUF1376 family)